MSQNSRREVAKRLKEEIDKATDPKTLAELTRQYAKVMPKQRRVRKPLEEPKKESNPIAKPTRTGSGLDDLPPEKRLVFDIVIRAEQIELEAKRQGLPVPTNACEQAASELGLLK